MCHTPVAQGRERLEPLIGEEFQHVLPAQNIGEVHIKWKAANPFHDLDGISLSPRHDPLRVVLEAHKAGRRDLIEMVVNPLIPIFAVSNISSKAPHRLRLSIGAVHLEDIGELPGSDEGHSEPVDGRSRCL